MQKIFSNTKMALLLAITIFAIVPVCAFAESRAAEATMVPPVANPCPRSVAGSVVENPPNLFSERGVLKVRFSYQTTQDSDGRRLFCFMTPGGLENPTLHLSPGDHLMIDVTNNVPASSGMSMTVSSVSNQCGAATMTSSSLNIHYHGTNTSPTCHQDEVIHTLINSGQTFSYDVSFPQDEPPGLYWYHPHVHGLSEAAVQGGASGAIIVEGLEDFQPAVAGLRQRVLMVRDQNVAGNPMPGGIVPAWDLTLNYIPIAFPNLTPAVIRMGSGEKQLWRVSNSAADTILDLQVSYDGVPQTLQIVGLDGVPTGSQDGSRVGKIVAASHIRMPPAGRAEFIVTGPSTSVRNAVLLTQQIDTGPVGDNDTARTLAVIRTTSTEASADDDFVPVTVWPAWPQRFEGLENEDATTHRKLYFSEVISDPTNPLSPTNFFITVDGATPVLFNANNPPAIVTHQGAVEDWTIENRTQENHEFHFHQIHFLVLSQNNFEINGSQPQGNIKGQFLDMIEVPYWDGNPAHKFPSVTVRMDFRGPDIGDFVYHCHILGHEDNGMMAIIRVLPAEKKSAAGKSTPLARSKTKVAVRPPLAARR